jgi:hypothetical protein
MRDGQVPDSKRSVSAASEMKDLLQPRLGRDINTAAFLCSNEEDEERERERVEGRDEPISSPDRRGLGLGITKFPKGGLGMIDSAGTWIRLSA